MITINQLKKSYQSVPVLKGLNAQLDEGKVYGIVGENGSGKTTFFKCLTGLEEFEGTIKTEINGLKNYMGYLPTEPYFFSKITGREYLKLLTQARGLEIASLDEKNIFDLPLDSYATNYSTGMKKKLGLFAVLLQENKVFILDEPFNGVDIQSNILILEILKKLKSMGKIILISSHIFSTLSEICDEIFLLQNGIFSKHVNKNDFLALEKEMKDIFIGSKIDKIGLR